MGREVKEFFHREGIHSTTIQLETRLESGHCQFECPRTDEESQEGLSRECVESSCCRKRISSAQVNITITTLMVRHLYLFTGG